MKYFTLLLVSNFIVSDLVIVGSFKYNVASLSELTFLTKEGKQLWESLSEKTKLPQYGSCWKEAVYDLQLGCTSLSEDVQSRLALRFADCFLQMSGYDRMSCTDPRDACLRNLSDRAFNAYTEFYTHTQSICYFLQSQIWHEEAQKTIDKLSHASILVSAQLEEAGNLQRKILTQQKDSLQLQRYLIDNGKAIASALEQSEEKISRITKNIQDSTVEHRKVLFEVFEKLSLLRSLVVGEMSWISSVVFYIASLIVGYVFTSISTTKQARVYILISLTINYFLERFIYSYLSDNLFTNYSVENLNSWIWMSRKTFIVISIIILIYEAFVYCDYNIVNHKLLIEIKNQNKKILNFFERNSVHSLNQSYNKNISSGMSTPQHNCTVHDNVHVNHTVLKNAIPKTFTVSPLLSYDKGNREPVYGGSSRDRSIGIDDIDNVSVVSEKSKLNTSSVTRETPYNLRSSKVKDGH